ncbi:hypothetical protein IPF86_01775 [Candidatus Nomurabacteria bacterium]|nr:MAG: hypothetical protein IPF86_01775 [Candidatus Nomurabacteria bacterium]
MAALQNVPIQIPLDAARPVAILDSVQLKRLHKGRFDDTKVNRLDGNLYVRFQDKNIYFFDKDNLNATLSKEGKLLQVLIWKDTVLYSYVYLDSLSEIGVMMTYTKDKEFISGGEIPANESLRVVYPIIKVRFDSIKIFTSGSKK